MSGADLAFQTVMYGALAAAVAPVAVEVHPPHDAPLPMVQIGNSEATDFPAGGKQLLCEVHTWSRSEGSHGAKTLQDQIHDALHAQVFTDAIWKFTPIRENDRRAFLDVDNETWHGVQRFLVIATPLIGIL